MSRNDARKYARDRDRAFTKLVMNDDLNAMFKFSIKWGVKLPKDINILKAGVYKAVRYCTDIPQNVKDVAYTKCIELGFSPVIEECESKDGR